MHPPWHLHRHWPAALRAGSLLDRQAASKEFGKLAGALQRVLAADSEAATGKVHEAGRALLNVVWLSAVDKEFLEG